MKVSEEKSAADRQALLGAAARLIRERGYNGVGVAEISRSAGVTQGSLYSHFRSKSELAAEALRQTFEKGQVSMIRLIEAEGPALEQFADYYLSKKSRMNMSSGCPMAASASEVARQDNGIRTAFAEGFANLAAAVEASLIRNGAQGNTRRRARAILAAMIGGVAMARAMPDPDLADDIAEGVRELVGEGV
jgi:TetR/AcrR family transcriptional regulator, transcriptional repressor for nem operon